MKRFLKLLAAGLLGVLLLIAGFIGLIEWQSWRSLRQVKEVVAQMVPGTPFTNVVQQLGKPVDAITDSQYMLLRGTRKEEGFVADKVMHMFVHRGPPYRWILIYTDKDSERVVYADWSAM
jgi:hypothetical protein